MDTTYWSRRRLLTVAGAATAATAVSLAAPSRALAAAATASAGSTDLPRLPQLPDTARAKVVTAWKIGGRSVKSAATQALTGSAADIESFLSTGLASATAEDNRFALLKALPATGKAPPATPPPHSRPATTPSPPS